MSAEVLTVLTPRRVDARRNREAILRAADEAFAQGSDVVPLEEIARRAGLGRATVYRHFPDRQALGVAVARQQLDMLKRLVDDGSPAGFRDALYAVLSAQVTMRPLVQIFHDLPPREQCRYADALIAVLTPALRRAQSDGGVRDDVEPADLLLLFEMVEAAVGSRVGRAASQDRLIEVLLDGLFTQRASR